MVVFRKDLDSLKEACKKMHKEKEILHVGVINSLGRIIAGGFKNDVEPFLDDEKIASVYMQLQLDFKMRQELDGLMGEIDYISSRRKRYVIINIPHGQDLVVIFAKKDADDKKIVKKAEELFDKIEISSFSYQINI